MTKKVFRHTPHRAANAIKILAGTKTNATIRDVEETIEDIEEKEGVVTSIDKDKINGNGWNVKDSEGNTYQCNCASNMYQLPETEEYSGVYYPTEQVSVKFTINPVLKTNTITEITSLSQEEEKLDLSKWKHGDKSTTVIAKPKSAISISDAFISFNYNNTNEVTADDDEIKTKGKKTSIDTSDLNINSENINIGDQSLNDYIQDQTLNTLDNANMFQTDYGVDISNNNNIGQLNIYDIKFEHIPADREIVIADLKDPSMFPPKRQRQPLLTGGDISELYIYPNGLVTVKSSKTGGAYGKDAEIFSTHNWQTFQYTDQNLLIVAVLESCPCCPDGGSGVQKFFNYCPSCQTWNTLYTKRNVITCGGCNQEWCQNCGHLKNASCTDKSKNLKKYGLWNISAISTPCEYCNNYIPYGQTKEYANYCPKCHEWGILSLEDKYVDGELRRFFHCRKCNEYYCSNCSISQKKGFITSFLNDNTNYDYQYFINKYSKMTHIRDD